MTEDNRRRFERIAFDKSQNVRIMALDASWQISCSMADISACGARLTVDTLPADGVREFYLLLTANNLVSRRCELVRVDGNDIGVQFVPDEPMHKPA